MSARAIRLDFLEGPRPRVVWRRLALAAGIVLAAGAAATYFDARSTHDFLLARHAAALREQAPPRPASLSPQEERELAEQVRAINLHVRALNMPWDAILRAIEPHKTMDVSLLSLDTTGRAGALRLAGRAARSEDMTDYVSFLAEKKNLKSAYLAKHELVRDGGYRFDVEVEWLAAR